MLQGRLKWVQFYSSEKDLCLIFVATFCVMIIDHVFIHESMRLVALALFLSRPFLTASDKMELNLYVLWDNSFPLVF